MNTLSIKSNNESHLMWNNISATIFNQFECVERTHSHSRIADFSLILEAS